MKEVIKEEKDHRFKSKGYYKPFFRKRNSFSNYSNHNFDLSSAIKLGQTLQKLVNSWFL
jgi:hypothetical protein